MANSRRGAGSNKGVLLLGGKLMDYGLDDIPPVTLALIAGQTAIFLDYLPQYFPSANSICISPYLVYHHWPNQWRRLILSQFFHGDDMHLYYNMVSLLYKGSMLERKFGTLYFAYLTAVFTALTGVTYVGLGLGFSQALNDQSYLTSCAVGFSGVLFAMKVLTTYYGPDGTSYALGMIPVPNKYIFWAELVLIQIIAPNASFVGHLAGILVGLAYVKGPVKLIMDAFLRPEDEFDETPRRRRRSSGSSDDENQNDNRGGNFFSNIFSSIFSRRGHRGNTLGGNRFHQDNYYSSQASNTSYSAPYPNAHNGARPSAPQMDPRDIGFESYNNDGGYANQGQHDYARYTGGLDEDEQYRRAMEQSLRDRESRPTGLYPDLDDLRNRRANFYQ